MESDNREFFFHLENFLVGTGRKSPTRFLVAASCGSFISRQTSIHLQAIYFELTFSVDFITVATILFAPSNKVIMLSILFSMTTVHHGGILPRPTIIFFGKCRVLLYVVDKNEQYIIPRTG